MCGIFGVLKVEDRRPLDERRFASALALLDHRGPDARCVKAFGSDVLLGHTRLSIIDLDERSNQPMVLRDRYWLIYNGEIFNYIELKQELSALGCKFVTSGDAEVILQAYAQWGEDCVKRFNGMWAFAIYDRAERTLFCSRDRFGEKPFCYALSDGQFLFASELKAIAAYRPDLVRPDYNVISNFCRTSVGAQQAQTWLRPVQRLQPGHNLVLRNGRVTISRYWTYPGSDGSNRTFDEAREQYAGLFADAVRIRLRSDVPLGLTLSSGLDSSSIACAMHRFDPKPHHFFTSGFAPEQRFETPRSIYRQELTLVDEASEASRLAAELGQRFHRVTTDYSDLPGALSKIVYHLESGNSSPAVIPLMQLLAFARRHVTVVLEGQGADELLGGYVSNGLWPAIAELIAKGRLAEAARSFRRFSGTYSPAYSVKMMLRGLSNRLHLLSAAQQRLTGIDRLFGPSLRDYRRIADYPSLPGESWGAPLARTLQGQHSGGLVNLLHYGDAISMAHSLESRMPFMDHRLVEFVWGLPAEFKIKLGVGKYLHREAMRGLVPDRIVDEHVKFGFNSPIGQQFKPRDGRSSDAVDILLSRTSLDRGLFDADGLRSVVAAHQAGRHDHGPLLFRLLSTELWFRTFVDGGMFARIDQSDGPERLAAGPLPGIAGAAPIAASGR